MKAKILEGNVLETLKDVPACSVQCVVTSPPYYGLRDYGVDGQIGLEETPEAYVEKLVQVFREVRRVLKDDGTLWLNLGDTYAGGKGQNARNDHNLEQRKAEGRTMQRRETTINILKTLPADNAAMLRERGIKPKDLIGIPWMVAFALRSDGWYLRQDIIWNKPNPMPESMTDRCTKSHEYIFLLSKSKVYYFDQEAIKEPAAIESLERLQRGVSDHHKNVNGAPGQTPHSMNKPRLNVKRGGFDGKTNAMPGREAFRQFVEMRNKRSVWTVTTKPYKEAHFAVYPPDLIEPCILAGSREGDTVLDPFNGSGTTGEVSIRHNRFYIGCELNPDYVRLTKKRLSKVQPVLPQEIRTTLPAPDGGDSPRQQALFTPEADSPAGDVPTPAPRR